MTRKRLLELPRSRIPEPDGFIVCARCEKFRIAGEGD